MLPLRSPSLPNSLAEQQQRRQIELELESLKETEARETTLYDTAKADMDARM